MLCSDIDECQLNPIISDKEKRSIETEDEHEKSFAKNTNGIFCVLIVINEA